MDLHRVLTGSFALIGCALLMSMLYFILFGNRNLQGEYTGTVKNNYDNTQEWRGVLYYAAENSGKPLTEYYYKYCYLPQFSHADSIDASIPNVVTTRSINLVGLDGFAWNYRITGNNYSFYINGSNDDNYCGEKIQNK